MTVDDIGAAAHKDWAGGPAIKSASFDAVASLGDVVAAVAGKKLAILAMFFDFTASSATTTIKFRSGTSRDLSGRQLQSVAGIGKWLPYSPVPWFTTDAGEALTVTISGAGTIGGVVLYAEID